MLQAVAETDEIASRFVAARKTASALPQFPGTLPSTLDQAYAIQAAATTMFGETVIGWKVGRINPPFLEQYGANRLVGPAFVGARKTIAPDETGTGYIYRGGFGAGEAEFMFRIGTAPVPGKTSFTLEETADLIDAVFVGFEIASSPFPGVNDVGPMAIIADFGNNNGLLVGPEIADWRNSGLDQWAVETSIDGVPVGTGLAASFPDGPLGSVRFMLENLAARGIAVAPGTLVSTGAVSGVHQVQAGQHVVSRFGEFCTIDCRIEHANAA